MKLLETHRKRAEKVKEIAGKNKIFVVMTIIALILLTSNFLFKNSENPAPESQIVIENAETEETDTDGQTESFRFYFIDLIVLVTGGGFCTVMIIRERKKTKNRI